MDNIDGKKYQRIVFIDRDGTINKLRTDYVKNLSEFELLPNIAEQLAKLQKFGFKIVVITNQSAINKGLLKKEELEKIHEFMKSELSKLGCNINAIYYCPHTSQEYCDCRKPKTGLFKQAISDFKNLDLQNSWMIGDKDSDIQAGLAIGVNTFKTQTNGTIYSAIEHILSHGD